jgi:hypothetical protein
VGGGKQAGRLADAAAKAERELISNASNAAARSGIARNPSAARPTTTPWTCRGSHRWSSWESWTLRIRQPTVSGISFTKLVDAMPAPSRLAPDRDLDDDAAPDDRLGTFTQAAVATTATNGGWTASLPTGPSRLVEAVHDGARTLEPSTSRQVHLAVPARIKRISVWPRRVV